ncbi:TPA: hypothetical protein QDB06_000874 [Burkholderia vietnamiensis]|nr:hypothetical protein [Burkholderia vietnamiensis]
MKKQTLKLKNLNIDKNVKAHIKEICSEVANPMFLAALRKETIAIGLPATEDGSGEPQAVAFVDEVTHKITNDRFTRIVVIQPGELPSFEGMSAYKDGAYEPFDWRELSPEEVGM